MKTLNEFLQEVENLNEISKATLASYIKKGSADAVERMGDASRAGMSGRRKEADKGYDKAHKRVSGVRTAATKLQYKNEEVVNERDYHIGQGEKIQKRTLKWMKDRSKDGEHVGAPGLNAMNARTAEHKARRGVKKVRVKEDKALAFVIDKLKKQYPGGVLTKGDKMPEPSAAQKKKNAEIRAQRAKEDGRDETEKATSGRYNDRSRSD